MKICLETSFSVMELVTVILAFATLAFMIYEFVIKKIWDDRAIEREQWTHVPKLKNEIKSNLETITQLEKNNLNSKSVYDPVQRPLLDSLKLEELTWARDNFFLFLESKLKNEYCKTDPAQVFENIKKAYDILDGLKDRLKKSPKEPAANAAHILIKKSILALKSHLENIKTDMVTIRNTSHIQKK